MNITPNAIAYLMLLLWPLLVWQFYRRMGPARALIWSMLGAYMVLPELAAFDLPTMPELNKSTLPALAVVVISWLQLGRHLPLLPESRLGQGLILMFVISPFVTVLTNPDPLVFASGMVVPGMRIYDSVAAVVTQSLYILPFWLARRDLARPEAMRDLLAALCLGALLYALPMMLESQISPQLHLWIYGYFQHDFAQSVRFGGYRPFVFMPHGLWVAFFAVMCLMAASCFLRQGPAEHRPKQLSLLILCLCLVAICKSFGPGVYAMAALPLLLLLPMRAIVVFAAALAVLVILYPLLRGLHLVPVDAIMALADQLSTERAQSFGFRLMNEESLLSRAAERPWFGWGGYGRNFMHDPFSGDLINIADGAWIIRIGTFGWLGYLAEFGLLALPLLLCGREALSRQAVIAPEVATVALILAFNLCDLLPNATLVPLTWMMAGALLGQAELLRAARLSRALAERQAQWGEGRRTVI